MKEQQKKLITDIMNDDAKDGLYISPTKSNADMNIGFTDQWKDTPINIGGQTKQTAVEWLVEQIKRDQNQKALSASEWAEVIEQAKQMEKEHMEAAWNNGYKSCKEDIVSDKMTTFENYLKTYE